nr:hypothetical protein BaRGS_006006 [Batillaria attramentaria]
MDFGNFANDIGLVELSQEVMMNAMSVGRPACVPAHGEVIREERPTSMFDMSTKGCWITGWGATLGTANSDQLNEIKLSVIDQNTCQRRWPGYITPSQMCLGTGSSGACRGDSGGPVVCSKMGRFYLVGIVSWGEDTCVLDGYPDVVTRVASYRNWIRSIVGS